MDTLFERIRRIPLRRGPDKWLGGVCGGLADILHLDVAWVRIGFLLFGLLPGPALGVYLLLWLLVPAQDGSIALQDMLRRR
ncbi:MAG: PspC domain-containing protein [Actinomycetota bacterium]|nr:PspC domain-containing protein [Actinomycetota bacterium]